MVLLSLGMWAFWSGMCWVLGPLKEIPRSLPWCVSLGAAFTTPVITSVWLKGRRFRGSEPQRPEGGREGSVLSDRSVANRDLTFRYERAFHLWSYGASHRQLVLRAGAGDGSEGSVEIEFLDVLGMKVKSRYRELLISPAPDSDPLDEFVVIPEKHKADYVKLLVTDGSGDGFVICRALHVHEK
ncbi:hypothetical protein ACIRPU_03585 [Streptomyces sp. NPDC102259]|uniref:hypothetical protein n=1 Tax=Streptomyces sp. NPDC102259 TaxID=3366148 RepID=UPI0038080861